MEGGLLLLLLMMMFVWDTCCASSASISPKSQRALVPFSRFLQSGGLRHGAVTIFAVHPMTAGSEQKAR